MRTRSAIVAAIVLLGLLGPAVSQAFAISVRDLVALSREGVSDPVLVALIETDGSKFTLNADDIRGLRYQGLSDTVLVAMIRTARSNAAAEPPAPTPVEPAIEPISPPQPAPVIVHQTVVQKVEVQAPTRQVEYSPIYVPVYVAVPTKPVEVKKAEPVYWGWGGQRRPDAWKDPVIIK